MFAPRKENQKFSEYLFQEKIMKMKVTSFFLYIVLVNLYLMKIEYSWIS